MSKFTPGPWQVKHTDKVSYVFSKTNLADVFSEAFRDTANQEANANLIAAAPEMYDALRTMVSDDAFEELCQSIGEQPEWLKAARAALAKADGK